MDYQQLVDTLQDMHVTVNDPYRAGLYFDYIDQVNTFFGNVQRVGLEQPEYDFCRPALTGELLSELAGILDFYVSPATQGVLNSDNYRNLSYDEYFNQHIFNADANIYNTNIQLFRQTVPISAAALVAATQSFRDNIQQACRRIYADRAQIESLFSDRYKLPFLLRSLANIRSTGSDFHKGGKQVLILTFNAFSTVRGVSVSLISSFSFKLVYKPSDIEADCLLAGNSVAVNRALGTNFMANSLFEIYNNSIAAAQHINPNLQAQPLPVYRILPMAYQSGHNNAPQSTLRNAYGYIEYLNDDVSIPASTFFGYCPFASSDYIIFKSENSVQITENFYHILGAMTAISGSFSIIDLHIENVRVQERLPYFIDMEVSLVTPIDDIEGTELLSHTAGGVNFHALAKRTEQFQFFARNAQQRIVAVQLSPNKIYSNRLWSMSDNGQKQLIQVNWDSLTTGFDRGMEVLRTMQGTADFAAWSARLNNVVVRYLPYGTADFLGMRNGIYISRPSEPATMGMDLNTAVTNVISGFLEFEYKKYVGYDDERGDHLPDFVVLDDPNCGADYLAGDIPVFYHRIGSTGILNSHGQNVPIPAQMTVTLAGQDPVVIPVGPPNDVVPRPTFFANAPTQNQIIPDQVTILGGAGFGGRSAVLRGSITHFRNTIAQNPAAVFEPIDA